MKRQKRADRRKFHFIYKTFRVDGRYYIGMHSTDDIEDGYLGSGKLLTRSIKRHGAEAHCRVVLEFCATRVELRIREKQIINEDLLLDDKCMNLKAGGEGNSSEDSYRLWERNPHLRVEASERAKRNWRDPEYRQKLINSMSSQVLSDEHRQSISTHAKERWANMSQEQRAEVCQKISEAGKARGNGWEGKKHSAESRAKMSESAKARPKRGPHSAETRAKIANKAKQRGMK